MILPGYKKEEPSPPATIFARLLAVWQKRARLPETILPRLTLFCEEKLDFPTERLPFAGHPRFEAAVEEDRNQVLSCAWLSYNRKTVDMEERIVGPACMMLARGELPGTALPEIQEAVRNVFVEEGNHIHTLFQVNQLTRVRRQLNTLSLRPATIVDKLERRLAQEPERSHQALLRLATAVIAEVSVTDYLSAMKTPSSQVQPLNQAVTEWHRKEELTHASLFRALVPQVFAELSESQRRYFLRAMLWARRLFYNDEWRNWRHILRQTRLPGWQQILDECAGHSAGIKRRAHLSGIYKIIRKTGISQSQMIQLGGLG